MLSSSKLSHFLPVVLDGLQAVFRDDAKASVIFIIILVTLDAHSGRAMASEVCCSLGSCHARLDASFDLLFGLHKDVESVFNLLNIAAEAWVDEMLTHFGAEEADANLVEPENDDQSDVESLILFDHHHCQGQRIVQKNCSCVGGGLELEQLGRSDAAS